jgi:uncharacterized protein with PQ loop repeat
MNYYALFIALSIFGYTIFGLGLLCNIIQGILIAFSKHEYEEVKYTPIFIILFALFYAIYQYLNWSQL